MKRAVLCMVSLCFSVPVATVPALACGYVDPQDGPDGYRRWLPQVVPLRARAA